MQTIGLLAVAGSTIVIFGYLGFIYWLDRYEREPFWIVLATFAWGAIGGTCIGCSLSALPTALAIQSLGPDVGGVLSAVVFAPLAEEFTKALVFVALMYSSHIDNETDGLIYGAATGLGFAALENALYFMLAEDTESLMYMVVIRTLFTSLVHCISSALIGMALGWARHRPKMTWPIALGVGYAAAVICHATWNGLASAMQTTAGAMYLLLGCLLVIAAAGLMFMMTQWSLNREHKVIKKHLQREAALGTLPEAHTSIIPYWTRRRGDRWLPRDVPKEEYVRAATLLAFRSYQAETAPESDRGKYAAEIDALRNEVRSLLARG